MPAFEDCANAAMVRSISPASRTPTGLSSTPNDGATAWIALNWAGPIVRSRSTATRVRRGAISLSSSSHFAPKPNSKGVKPVVFPPGRARLSTKPMPTGSPTFANTMGTGAGRLLQCLNARGGRSQNHVRRERPKLLGISVKAIGVARCPAGVDPYVAAVSPARLLQPLDERDNARLSFRIVRGQVHQNTDPPRPFALLRACRKRPRGRCAAEQRDELASPCVEHGLPSRNPLCQLSACSGCPGSTRRSLGQT